MPICLINFKIVVKITQILKWSILLKNRQKMALPNKLPNKIEITYKAICEDNYASNRELAERTNQSERTVRNHIAELKKLNYIKRVDSKKNGHWEIIDKS